MTAPDVNADVRARFEAWHDAKWPPPKPGEPYHWRVAWDSAKRDRWAVWQAAHADMAGEVRELVEATREYREAEGSLNGTNERLRRYWAARDTLDAVLAKFTHQEKP